MEYCISTSGNQWWICLRADKLELRFECANELHASKIVNALRNNPADNDWQVELANQAIEAWNTLGSTTFGKETDVIPYLLDCVKDRHSHKAL